MTLTDLLDTLRRDILQDTSDEVVDGDDPRLWTDTTLIRYINEAQRIFAKKTLVLRKKILITTVEGQREYLLDPSVVAVLSARFLGNSSYQFNQLALNPGVPPGTRIIPPDRGDLGRTGHADLDGWHTSSMHWFDSNIVDRMPPGKPIAFATDDSTGANGAMMLRSYPLADMGHAGCTIELRVGCKPTILSADIMDASPDIPEDYHMQILDYAAFRALKVVDHEMGDPQRASEFKDEFDRNTEIARREMQRKMFTPQTWRFGGNGFSYAGN